MLSKKVSNCCLKSAFSIWKRHTIHKSVSFPGLPNVQHLRDTAIRDLMPALQKIFDTYMMFRSSNGKNAHTFSALASNKSVFPR